MQVSNSTVVLFSRVIPKMIGAAQNSVEDHRTIICDLIWENRQSTHINRL